ncbi:PREDICTED: sorting nexin-29-like [Priapulus caudatus]|uniref:Sorting nexin-29-like n=1 Tax=Priapulus caudatus TaxID=37621 RepID=A0ABM1F2B7_PRICU|nr:PREDICTED: sorting nexin-29-like [Priapulus caudatus]
MLALAQKTIAGADPEQSSADRQQLLSRLLDAVKQCQVRFGGRAELATDGDSRVSCLCAQFECVLQHGLRQTNKAFSALRQVTGISKVAGITIDNEPLFWHCVREFLSKHELERYMVLKHVTTDSGRARAWLRSALNEHSLERYMHLMVNDTALVSHFYEDWALVADQERSSMLPVMAAGLGSILFAINIDNEDLNGNQQPLPLSSMDRQRPAISHPPPFSPEPKAVMAVVPSDPKKERRKKKKVPKKIVSFDDDDTSSTSVTSSSVTSPRSLYQTYVFSPPTTPPVTRVGMVTIEPNTPSVTSALCNSQPNMSLEPAHALSIRDKPGLSSHASDSNLLASNPTTVLPSHQSDPNLHTLASQEGVPRKLSLALTNIASPLADAAAALQSPATSGTIELQTVINAIGIPNDPVTEHVVADEVGARDEGDRLEGAAVMGEMADATASTAAAAHIVCSEPAQSDPSSHDAGVRPSPDASLGDEERQLSTADLVPGVVAISSSTQSLLVGREIAMTKETNVSDRSTQRHAQHTGAKQQATIVNKSLERVAASAGVSPENRQSVEGVRVSPSTTCTLTPVNDMSVGDLYPIPPDECQSETDSVDIASLDFGHDTAQAAYAISLAQLGLSVSSDAASSRADAVHPPSISQEAMSPADLRQALVAMMLRKEEVDEQNRSIRHLLEAEMETASALRVEIEEIKRKFLEKEEKTDAKIKALTRENELLKQQLKKYVGAVQMLKRDGAKASEAFKDLVGNIEPAIPEPRLQRDYSTEAREYEQKLIQVAEMHGELMEFNEHLHKQLQHKDYQLRRLREELVDLRGPLAEPQTSDDDLSITSDYDSSSMTASARALINIWIPSAFLRGKGSDAHHVYQVYVRIRDEEWNIYRRYAQFYELHSKVKKMYQSVNTFDFPPKKALGNKEVKFVEERRRRLQHYLRCLVNMVLQTTAELAASPSKETLTNMWPFFGEPLAPAPKTRVTASRKFNIGRQRPGNGGREAEHQQSPQQHYTGL